jgi:hypothetical protein
MGCHIPPTRERVAAAYGRLQRETGRQADRNGVQWTGAEMEILGRSDLTHKQAALMLGRTFAATRLMRYKLRKGDPKAVGLAGLPRLHRDGASLDGQG